MWRFLPLAGLVILIAIAFGVRPLLQWRRHGTFGIFLFRSGRTAQHVRDALLIVMFAVLLGQAIVATQPRYLDLLVTEHGPVHAALQVLGAALMLCGIVFFAVAQLHLGASWRIGIDADAKPGLVTDGLYGYSRNPIYVGLLDDHRRLLRACSRPCCPPSCWSAPISACAPRSPARRPTCSPPTAMPSATTPAASAAWFRASASSERALSRDAKRSASG